MKKNAFTLVELLAVIAVLGIILIVAVPSVQNIIEESRKNTFLADAQTIYRTANIYSLDIVDENGGIFNSNGENRLDIRDETFDYCIILDSSGDIISVTISNGKYIIEGDTNFLGLTGTDVVKGNMNSYVCE